MQVIYILTEKNLLHFLFQKVLYALCALVYFNYTRDDCFGSIVMDEIKYTDREGSMGNTLRKERRFHDFPEFIETFWLTIEPVERVTSRKKF